MLVRPGKKIPTKIFIGGNQYSFDDLPFCAKIPDQYFTKKDGLQELKSWLQENTDDVWWISFHDKSVLFKNESDAIYMKLVLG